MAVLGPGEIHIWTACLPPNPTPEFENILSQAERDSAHRMLTKHRLAYVFAHAVLRDILSRYLSRPPGQIRFDQDSFGKPFLVGGDARVPLQFNMSHSGKVVLVSLACERHIGVDVEEVRPLDDLTSIAESNFTRQECAFVLRHAPEDRGRAFYRCWTRKEAYVKAVGKGLSIPLKSFDVSNSVAQCEQRLPRKADTDEVESWWLVDVEVPAGYLAAVAVEKGFDRLVYAEWRAGETARLRP